VSLLDNARGLFRARLHAGAEAAEAGAESILHGEPGVRDDIYRKPSSPSGATPGGDRARDRRNLP
jgi:hypothetical protein